MAIEGPLRELALSDVFQLLDLSRKTGILTVRNESREKPALVRFDRGAVVGAEFPESSGRIGHLLLRAGKVTERQVDEARTRQQAEPWRPLGALLVEMGVVTEEEVRRQLRFQVEETIFELIRWQDGYFRFEETAPAEVGMLAIRVPTESLLMEAARRIDEWTTLESRVPDMSIVLALVPGDSDEGTTLDLHPAEWEVLAEIDGERTLKAIAAELGRSDFEVAKIAFGLVSAGLVAVVEDGGAAPSTEGSSPLTEGIAEVERAFQEKQFGVAERIAAELVYNFADRADTHLLLGRALGALGRWSEGMDALVRAAQLDPLSAPAQFHLGFAAARSGDLRRAEEAWSTYLRLPDSNTRRREVALEAVRAVAILRRILDEERE